ncbi:MAG: hypothetical protein SGCHY_005328 [Lobulomycetales sp.]
MTLEEREAFLAAGEKRIKSKIRSLGNIRFVGELFKLRIIADKVMRACVNSLLTNVTDPKEEAVEFLCELMSTIGSYLESQTAVDHITTYFERIAVNLRLEEATLAQLKRKIDMSRLNSPTAVPTTRSPEPSLHIQIANAAPAEGSKKIRGKGGFDRSEERKAAMSIKDQSLRLSRLLEILEDPENPHDFKTQTVTEGWRAWHANMKKVKSCIDGCFGGNRDNFLKRHAPEGKVLKLSKWNCCCQPEE